MINNIMYNLNTEEQSRHKVDHRLSRSERQRWVWVWSFAKTGSGQAWESAIPVQRSTSRRQLSRP